MQSGTCAASPLEPLRISKHFICYAEPLIKKLVYQESYYNYCHQTLYFKTKMHQIRFRLRLRPRPRWGAHGAPHTPKLNSTGPTSKGRRKGKEKGRKWKGEKRGKKRNGRRGKGVIPPLAKA